MIRAFLERARNWLCKTFNFWCNKTENEAVKGVISVSEPTDKTNA